MDAQSAVSLFFSRVRSRPSFSPPIIRSICQFRDCDDFARHDSLHFARSLTSPKPCRSLDYADEERGGVRKGEIVRVVESSSLGSPLPITHRTLPRHHMVESRVLCSRCFQYHSWPITCAQSANMLVSGRNARYERLHNGLTVNI